MLSLIVALAGGGGEEGIDVRFEAASSMTVCADKRAAKIAALRAGPDAGKYRSYQILCITVMGNAENRVTLLLTGEDGRPVRIMLQLD